MAAIHGSNGRVFVNGYDISTYLNSFGLDMSVALSDITPFTLSAKKYIEGQSDGTSSGEGFWDGGLTAIDAILAGIKSGESIWSYYPGQCTNGKYGYAFRALRSDYGTQLTVDDAVRFSLAAQVSKGEDRVRSTGETTLSATGSSETLDLGSGGTTGAVIYFHATAVTGTIELVVQHSTNGTTWTTLVALANVSAIGAQRVEAAGTVNRYVRVTATLDEGESISFLAGIKKN